jgi:hypothetical protein
VVTRAPKRLISPEREPGYLQEALASIRRTRAKILAERGGRPIDVDSILDEMRGVTGPAAR